MSTGPLDSGTQPEVGPRPPFVGPGRAPWIVWIRNIWFERLTMRQKAVAVARDVLDAIEEGSFVARPGIYFELHSRAQRSFAEAILQRKADLQRVLAKEQCDVCAIGAVFASVARLGDGCEVKPGTRYAEASTIFSVAWRAFTDQELTDMEFLFELKECRERKPTPGAMSRFQEYLALNSRGRMRRIMEAVILNDGSFLGGKELIEAQQSRWTGPKADAAWATPEPNSL